MRRPPTSPLFPYTTLFRSCPAGRRITVRKRPRARGPRTTDILADVGDIGTCDPALRAGRSEEHTSELQSRGHLVCRLLLEKKKQNAEQRGVEPRHADVEVA